MWVILRSGHSCKSTITSWASALTITALWGVESSCKSVLEIFSRPMWMVTVTCRENLITLDITKVSKMASAYKAKSKSEKGDDQP